MTSEKISKWENTHSMIFLASSIFILSACTSTSIGPEPSHRDDLQDAKSFPCHIPKINNADKAGDPFILPGSISKDTYAGKPAAPESFRRAGRRGAGGLGSSWGAAQGIGAGGADAAAAATSSLRRDPLALDLDGDGIETSNAYFNTEFLFDHDGDGVKISTGWLKPDDGWLVLDRNGNGTIDSGRELFGVNTLKRNGQWASDGFDALRDLDDNQDGKIDAADSVFTNLRIWRDLNRDGKSQANEMTTLTANNIISIGLRSTATRTDLGNGNIQTAVGCFTRRNGTTDITGTTEETSGLIANLDLVINTFHREFPNRLPWSRQFGPVANLQGSGQVRDLLEAMTLSSDLGRWVQTYLERSSRAEQVARLDGFIERWANTSNMLPLKAQAEALAGSGVMLNYHLTGLKPGTSAYNDFLRKLGIVERFMGFTYGGPKGQARFKPLDATAGRTNVSLTIEQIANINLAYDRFKTDIYESLLLEESSRLTPYTIQFLKDSAARDEADPKHAAFANLEEMFRQAIASAPQQGLIDLCEFISAIGEGRISWWAEDFLIRQFNAAPELDAFTEELSSWTVRFASAREHKLIGSSRPNLLVGSTSADLIRGSDQGNTLLGRGGDDVIEGGAGRDVIEGGTGNDTLSGGPGSDLYRFARGWGQDTINNYDTGTDKRDNIWFARDISPLDIDIIRSGDNLILALKNGTDKVTVLNYFQQDCTSAYRLENILFANGTRWGIDQVKAWVVADTAKRSLVQ